MNGRGLAGGAARGRLSIGIGLRRGLERVMDFCCVLPGAHFEEVRALQSPNHAVGTCWVLFITLGGRDTSTVTYVHALQRRVRRVLGVNMGRPVCDKKHYRHRRATSPSETTRPFTRRTGVWGSMLENQMRVCGQHSAYLDSSLLAFSTSLAGFGVGPTWWHQNAEPRKEDDS